MPLLLHLDGLPGAGKTTLAPMWAEQHPGTLCLDIDLVRRSIGGWRDDLDVSGTQARRLAYRMAAQHLRDGYDVVVPQYAISRAFVDALTSVAARAGADHLLVVLDAGPEAQARLDARTLAALEPQHVEAGEVIARTGFRPTLRSRSSPRPCRARSCSTRTDARRRGRTRISSSWCGNAARGDRRQMPVVLRG